MMAFDKYLRAILEDAGREAQADNSTTIEAHHLLLAVAARTDTAPAQFLASVGLDHGAVRAALDREFEQGLRAAGTSLAEMRIERAKGAGAPVEGLGPSVPLVLERGVGQQRQPLRPEHLLIGILRAEVGIVPRALELAGHDRAALLARLRQTAAEDG